MRKPNRSRSYAVLPFLVALLAGCTDGPVAPVVTPRPVASVAVAPADLALQPGGTAALTATALDVDGAAVPGQPVAWESSDTTVATVSPGGVVTARRVGTAAIRATSGGRSGAAALTVGAPPAPDREVAWILISPAGGTIPQDPGTSRQLGVVARALDGTEITGRPVAWSTSDPRVATVSASGLLEAHAAGTAWVVAVVDGRRDSTTVLVRSLIARIETSPAELTLGVGDARTVVATALDEAGAPLARAFVWSTSDVAVATVDATGRVVATGAGTALLAVSSEGRRATVRVTVTGQRWQLARAGDRPLPTFLHTATVTMDGVAREAAVQVTGGTLRLHDGRYELRLQAIATADGATPVALTIASDGIVAYDMFTGAPLFFERDEWWNHEPTYRSRFLQDGRLELGWQATGGTPVVPLLFQP